MQTLALDIRTALRFLQRRAAASAVIVLTLALALAANGAAFAVLKAFLLSDLGVPEASRLHVISQTQKGAAFLDAWPNYQMLREHVTTFENVAAVLQADVNWVHGEETRQVSAARVTASFFPTMKVSPRLGREIAANEQGPNPAPVVVISDRMWRNSFASAPDVIGRTMALNGAPHTIVGVMPRGFALPPDIDAWLPFDLPQDAWTRIVGARQLFVFGRLAPGRTPADAQEELKAFGRRAEEASVANKDWSYLSQPVRSYYLSGADDTILLVQGGAFVLLLLAVTNLSSLLLAWAAERERETAVRLALGAAARDIARQHAVQSVLLTLAGGGAGLFLAQAAVPLLRALNPTPTLSFFLDQLRVDPSVVAFTLLIAAVAGGLVGLVPLRQSRRTDLASPLKMESRGGTATRSALLWQRAMAVSQAAITVMVLSAAALSVASFRAVRGADPGYATDGRGVFRIQLPDNDYKDAAARAAFMRSFLDHLSREPELVEFGATSTLPFGDIPAGSALTVEQENGEFTTEPRIFGYRRVTPGYARTMGIPLIEGRPLSAEDAEDRPTVALISKSLADRYWPGGTAVGKRFRRSSPGQPPLEITVVGVVSRVRDTGNAEAARTGETIYIPYAQNPMRKFSVVVKGRGGVDAAIAAGVHALRATSPGLAAYGLTTTERLAYEANAVPRLQMALLSAFALVAVGVALLGSYGVMSQLVANRSRELAVRLAVGEKPGGVLRLVLGQNARLAGAGAMIGAAAAWQGGRLLQALVTGADARAPWTYLAAAALTVGLTQLAGLVPARRAAATNV
ncbi:MAG: ADOP family duplicated permease, partial [Vicinamibacteria bacterium]|nr:ADOP family duplicated permease [Vicinamibacteria bacterium]